MVCGLTEKLTPEELTKFKRKAKEDDIALRELKVQLEDVVTMAMKNDQE